MFYDSSLSECALLWVFCFILQGIINNQVEIKVDENENLKTKEVNQIMYVIQLTYFCQTVNW